MRNLKIVLLCRWYWEENRRTGTAEGGMAQQLAEAVAALGHEVVVLSQSPNVETLEKTQIGALEVWLTPREKRRAGLIALRDKWAKQIYGHRKVYSDAYDLRDFLERRGPFDVLWAQSEEPDGLVAAVAAQRAALPPILTQIQALRYRFEGGVPVFDEKPALRMAFRHAARILANSEMIAGCLANYAGPYLSAGQIQAKVRVVHPNLQRDFLRTAREMTSVSPPEPGRVLFFGALNEGKGALVFMEALLKTKAVQTGASFAVIGDYTEKNASFTRRWSRAVEAARRQLAPGQLELLGKVPREEAMRQVRLANVVALPSLFDAFSRALVETLILGRPVVTTKRVGAWPLVNSNGCGLVIDPNEPVALAGAIDEVLRPGAPYAAKAAQFGPRLLDEFSPEAIAQQVAQHLGKIAVGR